MFRRPLISIVTGTVGSIVAYVIITTITSLSYQTIVIICLGALSVYLAAMLLIYRRTRMQMSSSFVESLTQVGISAVFTRDKPALANYACEAENALYFWGISAKRTTSTPELQEKILQIGRRNGDIRFLLFNPKGPNLKRKAADEGDDWRSWEKEIAATIQRLKTIAKSNGIEIKIRVSDEFPIWRMTILDCRRIYLHYFLSGKQGPQSPLFVIDEVSDSLFWPLFREFKEVWENHSMPA